MAPLGRLALTLSLALSARSALLAQQPHSMPGGELRILTPGTGIGGACPLKHTNVTTDIVGFVGRTTVKQVFHNPTTTKIEAVYVFPLPQDAAVDDMVMTVGARRIVGQIKDRDEARALYEAAKAAGHVASLLDQERPNIFTQSVANIEAGVEVVIEISYVETLRYEDGAFEWVFPMVVGPRYIPGGGSPPAPLTIGQNTPQVPDGSRITPPVTPPGTRAGHDISLTVRIDAGLELASLNSELHPVDVTRIGPGLATVTLKNEVEIPNRDFVLRYRLAGDEIGDAFLVHQDERGRFFTLILQPPPRIIPSRIVPRELIFVLDTSGSMSGFPIEKAKEVMKKLIDTMQPADTFNMITFSGDTRILWDQPRPATAQNIADAQQFLAGRQGGGGTEMMTAINAALIQTAAPPTDRPQPIRVVCFMTDGYVGNDMAIIDAVQKYAGTTRVFSFGIGQSVNRFLLDGMAQAGRGEVEYVTLASQADAAVKKFHERVLAPVLTDITIDWGTLPVTDVYPRQIPDLFSSKPLMIHGRLTGPAEGTITLRGYTGAGPYEDPIAVAWPATPPDHDALASLWARAKLADLMMQDYAQLQAGQFPEELKQTVTALGLEFRLMTQFTSFVVVEELTVTVGGEPVKVTVPVEMPEGVSYDGVFGVDSLTPASSAELSSLGGGGRGAPAGGARVAGASTAQLKMERAAREVANESVTAPPPNRLEAVRAKLAEPLRGLAATVNMKGRAGNLTLGQLKVTGYRVDVMIHLSDVSEQTVAALKRLGFERKGESQAVKFLIGTLDVRKLEELARLDVVTYVRPVLIPQELRA